MQGTHAVPPGAAWRSDPPPLPILQVPLKTTERRRLDADNLLRGTNVQECVFTKDGVKECTDGEMIWELADPDTTGIPNNFLKGKGKLKGTLKLGAAVKTIGKNAFLKTELTGLDLSDAASLEKIGAKAFRNTRITDTIETPFNVPTYNGLLRLLRPSTRISRGRTPPHGQMTCIPHSAAHRLAPLSSADWAAPNGRDSTAASITPCR